MSLSEGENIAFLTSSLSKSYGLIRAVSGVTVSVRKGAIGLLGPNGAGKSTLIKTLLGLIAPTEGSYKVQGRDEGYLDSVGYMPEHDCLPGGLTAVGFVSYMGRLSGLPPDVSMERTHEILDFVGLDEARYRKIKSFSTGMRQKVKLAQAMVHDPEILFFDEPTNGLDPEGRKEMLDLIRDVADSGKTIVLSTHLLPDVEYVCKDVMIMNNGELILYDSLENVLGTQNLIVRVKGDPGPFSGALRRMGYSAEVSGGKVLVGGNASSKEVFMAARESDAQVRYISYHSHTLEELFLQLVGDK
ncbi:MAG: ABC transporter ATP-binding protein [Candidatus Methanofastidiosa archaeon]|nr:ABC transporter ATP-binding protein [Candidatus Methanofastidiosa archaeon]